jgi:hypothetical protein
VVLEHQFQLVVLVEGLVTMLEVHRVEEALVAEERFEAPVPSLVLQL